jgi:hypothetical protein
MMMMIHVICKHAKCCYDYSGACDAPKRDRFRGSANEHIREEDKNDREQITDRGNDGTPNPEKDLRELKISYLLIKNITHHESCVEDDPAECDARNSKYGFEIAWKREWLQACPMQDWYRDPEH